MIVSSRGWNFLHGVGVLTVHSQGYGDGKMKNELIFTPIKSSCVFNFAFRV